MNVSGMNQKIVPAHFQRVRTLEFSDLRGGDVVLIRTRNNLYRFFIANERTLFGRLLGEMDRSHFPEAVLVGALINRDGRNQTLTSRLVIQSQAIFAIQRGPELVGLTTSMVVGLYCVRRGTQGLEKAQ